MAISKLMHMKETAGNPSRHLKRAIEYIMNPEKTNDQKYVKVNQALHVDEINSEQIYERMLYTKRIFGKEWGRQGYHFIISFADQDHIIPEEAVQIIDEIQREYLKDAYECVSAVHDNTEHLHGHLIFNSIDCVKGMKYHYKKGDWEKDILPCVNKVCKKWGLKELRLEERVDQERYGEHKNKWDDFLRAEIDDMIQEVSTYQEFLTELTKRDYEWKDGKYLSIRPKKMEKKRFRRTAQLGEEYTKERLEQRIYEEKKRKRIEYKIQNQRKYKKKSNVNVQGIQKRIILFIWRGQKYKNDRSRNSDRSSYYDQKKYIRQAMYLQSRGYYKKSQIVQRNQELWKLEKEAQKIRKKIYNQKQKTKNIQEEKISADEQLKANNELKRINKVLKDIRKEKQMTYSIMREIENKKQKNKEKEFSKK